MTKNAERILEDFDLYDEDSREHLHEAFDIARDRCPMVHSEADGGYYVVTRYEDVRIVEANPEIFSAAAPGMRGNPVRVPPLDSDLPLHRDFRRLLNPLFCRAYLLRYSDDMRRIARDAISTFIDRGEAELVQEFGVPFSAGSLAGIVFVTENKDLLDRGIAAVHRAGLEGTAEAKLGVAALASELLAEVEPGAEDRDDVLGALLNGRVDGDRPLTEEERLGVITVLLLGGLDTTRGMITNIAYHLATRPDIEDVLRSPDWWRSDMDEFIRFETTVAFMGRTVTRDVTLGGVGLKPGDRLALNFVAANHDPAVFDNPHELVFGRERNVHTGFGLGIHRCLGLNFARLQIQIAFEELLAATTNFRLLEEPSRQMGLGYNTPAELHVAFDPLV